MKGLAPVIVALSMWLPRGAAAEEVPLVRPDLLAHFGATAAISAAGYAFAAPLLEEPWARFGVGLGAGLAAGLAKEAADLAGLGEPDWRDLVADVVGSITGALLAWAIDHVVTAIRGRQRPPFVAASARFETG